jgi:HSP20 family molecular chaperone IbpA
MSFTQLIMKSLDNIDNSGEVSLRHLMKTYLTTQGVDILEIFKPPHDMFVDSCYIRIRIDIPGVNPESVDIDFINNTIEISGVRDDCIEEGNSFSSEIIYGKFTKKIKLPISVVNRESVNVRCDNGVLDITINREKEELNNFKIRL